jgi:phage-related minor tail protein
MAHGMGLMSEVGPEAIMPLGRDSSGHLGVRTTGGTGGAPTVNIRIENQTGAEMEVESSGVNWDERIGALSVNAVVKNIGSNGVIAKMIKAGR